MPIQSPKSSSQYASEILTALQATGITNTAPGGKARALADILANKMGQLEANMFIEASQLILPSATGSALDALGSIYNLPRIQASDASSPSIDNNFTFYVNSGTFGDINNGQDIIVPAGTRVFTAVANGPVYTVDAATTLSASASIQPFSASSLGTGSSGNALASIFNRSNFTNYTQSPFGALLVTNNNGIVSGRDAESDADYRYRLSLKLQSTGGNAEVNIRAAVLQIPGIQDLAFKPLAGTYEVFVYGISPNIPQSLLSLVQTAMNSLTAYPLTGRAIVPDLVGFSISTTLTLKKGLPSIDQSAVISSATVAAANYINNLSIGQELVINEIANLIMSSDSRILDVGNPDDPILQIFIWRNRLDGSRYSQFLLNNYIPAIGERIIVEQAISNPINLTIQ